MVPFNLNVLLKLDQIWPLLGLLAKSGRVLPCSCSQTFCNCSHSRIFLKILHHVVGASWKQKLTLETMFPVWQNWKTLENIHALWMFLDWRASSFCWRFIETDARKNSSRKATAHWESHLETWRISKYIRPSELFRPVSLQLVGSQKPSNEALSR